MQSAERLLAADGGDICMLQTHGDICMGLSSL